MLASSRKIWSSGPPPDQPKQPIRCGDLVYFHFAAFDFLRTYKSRLSGFSYRTQLQSARAGLSLDLGNIHQQDCYVGEKSIWTSTVRDCTFFIEFVDASMTSRSEISKIYNDYKNITKETSVEDAVLQEIELCYYASYLIISYWTGRDLDKLEDFHLMAPDPFTRRQLVMGAGLGALRELAALLDVAENISKQSDRLLCSQYF